MAFKFKRTYVIYTDSKGGIDVLSYKGYRYDRGNITTMLEKRGVVGDVDFKYTTNGHTTREVRCGI